MRSPIRRRFAVLTPLAALSVGILITAGCGGGGSGEGAKELFLQTATAKGPDPFTPSTTSDAAGSGTPSDAAVTGGAGARAGRATAARARALPGSTPGLYGGTKGTSSCDVERQIRFLTENVDRSRAFARGAGIGAATVPTFLRGLTPVTLRADSRLTDHGYRNGSATTFQSVLQAGTAVMVDDRGMPRVRCSCGNPLRPAVAIQGAVTHRGKPWAAYRPDRVVVIQRASEAVGSLVIVNGDKNTWIERATGTDGDDDRTPGMLPPYDPGADLFDPNEVSPQDPLVPEGPSTSAPTGTDTAGPSEPAKPRAPSQDPQEPPDASPPPDEPADPPTQDAPRPDDPGTPDGGGYPTVPDAPQATAVGVGPDADRG